MNPWQESLKLDRKAFEKLLNQKHLEGKITIDKLYSMCYNVVASLFYKGL
jgi:hypothetical protein